MAARAPRRIFANPFVITLAALPACFTESSPPPQQPREVTPTNPPEPAQPPPSEEKVVVMSNPPHPSAPATPPAVAYEQRWTVMKQGETCQAMAKVDCPKPTKAGGPMPTCNPPPPMKIACPDGFDGKTALQVVQYANTTECVIEPAMPNCPPKTACNPPP